MAKKVLTDTFSEPLNNAMAAKINIDAGDGNLTIDRLTCDEQTLASGVLQYLENQERPKQTLVSNNKQATLTLRKGGTGQRWFHFPWSTCNGATDWQIHLNPTISFDLTAHSDGGNIRLDLSELTITGVVADTGGGNMDLILPDKAVELKVASRTGVGNVAVEIGNNIIGNNIIEVSSGAGNVTVHIPNGIAASIHAVARLGKVDIYPIFNKVADNIYQSPGFEDATNKIDIKANSGAGNVIVITG